MKQPIKLYFDDDTAAWLRAQGGRKMSRTANEIIRAHMQAAKPSPVVVALNEIRDALTSLTITTAVAAPEKEPEENADDAKKLSKLY